MPSERQITIVLAPRAWDEIIRRRAVTGGSWGEAISQAIERYMSLTSEQPYLSADEREWIEWLIRDYNVSPELAELLPHLVDEAEVPDDLAVVKSQLARKLADAGMAGRLGLLESLEVK